MNLKDKVRQELLHVYRKELKDLSLIKRFIEFRLKKAGIKFDRHDSDRSASEYITIENDGYDIKIRFALHAPTNSDNSTFFITKTHWVSFSEKRFILNGVFCEPTIDTMFLGYYRKVEFWEYDYQNCV